MTGCQMNAGEQPTNLQRTANTNDQVATRSHYQMTQAENIDDYAHYGYSRIQRQDVQQDDRQQLYPVIDRNRLSEGITRLVLTNPTVEEAATLVTDKYVLVAYNGDRENRELVADQVKRSAISIAPRYLDVFITDNHDHFDEIERFKGQSSTDPAYERTIEQTIQEMKQSPQGKYDEETDHDLKIMSQKHQRLQNASTNS